MRHLGRWLLWTFALLAAAFILLQGWYAAHIWWWREHAPRETAFMAMRLAQLQQRHADARLAYKWVPYDRISVQLKRAVIAAEDGVKLPGATLETYKPTTADVGHALTVTVTDSGVGASDAELHGGQGTGLKRLRERLEARTA